MKSKFFHWISAARLRTIPLSISGIFIATAIAYYNGFFSWLILLFSLFTAIGFQIISNFANDYGDGIKGADNHRIGPKRLVQSGKISPKDMKKATLISCILTFICALLLIYISFGSRNFIYTFFFLLLGLGAVIAAIKYTVGNNAYGYRGLGDLFVFIFFGLVSVLGGVFLYIKHLDWVFVFPAVAVGSLSVGVLNLNNMRDYRTDKLVKKNTLVVLIGSSNAKLYHYNLIFMAMISFMTYSLFQIHTWFSLSYIIFFIPLIAHLVRVKRIKNSADFDLELKKLAVLTFLISIVFAIGHIF